MDNHSCVLIDPRPTDYIAEKNSPIVFKSVLAIADWSGFIDFYEKQKLSFETDACVFFTGQESFDAQMNNQIENGQIPKALLDQFTALGYMDPNSLDGQPRFHSSPRFPHVLAGTKFNGASLPTVWDIKRQYGVLPWTDMPFDETMGMETYFAAIPKASLDKAAKFLALIGGKDSIKYHWIVNGGKNNIAKMKTALSQAPLALGTPVCQPWDQLSPPTCSLNEPAHSTMVYKIDSFVQIFDHYIPFLKRLGLDYPIPYVLQGIVSINYSPLPAIPTNIAPTQKNVNILTQIVALYKLILSLVNKGRNLQAEPMFSNSNKFWNWLVVSSEDPTKVAATVKGALGVLISLLAFTAHGASFADVPDQVYTIVVDLFATISSAIALAGLVRKLINSFTEKTG